MVGVISGSVVAWVGASHIGGFGSSAEATAVVPVAAVDAVDNADNSVADNAEADDTLLLLQ